MDKTKDTPKEITSEMMKGIQNELRGYDLSWKDRLVDQIKKDKSINLKYRKTIKSSKLYNVLNGIVSDTAWKLVVYKQALILKDLYKKEMEDALSN